MVKEKQDTQAEEEVKESRHLTLINDDVNTFEHVIECLVSICNQTEIQAEQCAFITHYVGKCQIKKGSFESLRPYHIELRSHGLTVIIN